MISARAGMGATRTMGLGVAAVCSLLLSFAQAAGAGTTVRGARDISGLWVQYPFLLTFDPTLKRGEPQKVLLQPEYDARYKARVAAVAKGEAEGKPLATPSTLCLPVGMPGDMMGFAPLEIVIKGKTIYVFPEGWDPHRRIFMDGRSIPPPDDLEPSYAGYSVGRWEGDTLVVDTAGVKVNAKLEDVPHSDAMRINERFRLLDDDTLEIVFTITDPKAFKAPWVITRQYKDYNTGGPLTNHTKGAGKHPEHKGAELVSAEVVCNENNRNPTDENGVVGLQLGNE